MKLQLIHGEFSSQDAQELISQMIHIKIKYHENKVSNASNEEDIKRRESKIKRLQQELYDFKKNVTSQQETVSIEAMVEIS